MKTYNVNIQVRVFDIEQLIAAAAQRIEEDGIFDNEADALKFLTNPKDGTPSVESALLTLLDPASVEPNWGFEILDSDVKDESNPDLPHISCAVPEGTGEAPVPELKTYFVPMYAMVRAVTAAEAEELAASVVSGATGSFMPPRRGRMDQPPHVDTALGAIEVQGPGYESLKQLARVDVYTRTPEEQ